MGEAQTLLWIARVRRLHFGSFRDYCGRGLISKPPQWKKMAVLKLSLLRNSRFARGPRYPESDGTFPRLAWPFSSGHTSTLSTEFPEGPPGRHAGDRRRSRRVREGSAECPSTSLIGWSGASQPHPRLHRPFNLPAAHIAIECAYRRYIDHRLDSSQTPPTARANRPVASRGCSDNRPCCV